MTQDATSVAQELANQNKERAQSCELHSRLLLIFVFGFLFLAILGFVALPFAMNTVHRWEIDRIRSQLEIDQTRISTSVNRSRQSLEEKNREISRYTISSIDITDAIIENYLLTVGRRVDASIVRENFVSAGNTISRLLISADTIPSLQNVEGMINSNEIWGYVYRRFRNFLDLYSSKAAILISISDATAQLIPISSNIRKMDSVNIRKIQISPEIQQAYIYIRTTYIALVLFGISILLWAYRYNVRLAQYYNALHNAFLASTATPGRASTELFSAAMKLLRKLTPSAHGIELDPAPTPPSPGSAT